MTFNQHYIAAVKGGQDLNQFLLFNVSKTIFGIHVKYVQEVVEVDTIYHVPMMSDVISGVINLRGNIIPVIDLSMRFYSVRMDKNVSSKIIIIEIEDGGDIFQIGMLANSVVSVIGIAREIMQPAPAYGINIRTDFISNSVKINNNFIILIDIHKILDIDEISKLKKDTVDIDRFTSAKMMPVNNTESQSSKVSVGELTEENNYITFSIEHETYCIPTKRLIQIVIPDQITFIPNTLPFMKGIINFQGTAVPLVDFRLRCNLEEKKYDSTPWVFIVEIKGILVGLITESVTDMISIDKNTIQQTLHYTSSIDNDFIMGIAEVKDRLIIILDVDKILTNEELDKISDFESNEVIC